MPRKVSEPSCCPRGTKRSWPGTRCLEMSQEAIRPAGTVGSGLPSVVQHRVDNRTVWTLSHRSLRDGSSVLRSQAVPAWLPSFCPFGTRITNHLSPITSHGFISAPDTRLDSPPGSATSRPGRHNNPQRKTHWDGDCRTNRHRRTEQHCWLLWLADSN
jgi:hypothetical protein